MYQVETPSQLMTTMKSPQFDIHYLTVVCDLILFNCPWHTHLICCLQFTEDSHFTKDISSCEASTLKVEKLKRYNSYTHNHYIDILHIYTQNT